MRDGALGLTQDRFCLKLAIASYGWGMIGTAIALPQVSRSTSDARTFVLVASIVLPGAALAGAAAITYRRVGVASVLLLASAATPAYYLWPPNLIPLIVVPALLVHTWRVGHR